MPGMRLGLTGSASRGEGVVIVLSKCGVRRAARTTHWQESGKTNSSDGFRHPLERVVR